LAIFNTFPMARRLAEKGIREQVINPSDVAGEDGTLYCGLCGEKKRMYKDFPDPVEGDEQRVSRLLVALECGCDRAKKEKEKQAAIDKADMESIEKLRVASLMDDHFRLCSFDSFQTNQYNQRNLKICRRYATAFDKMVSENRGLLLWGGVGTGKTFAAACIANYLLGKKVPVIMTSFLKILNMIQADRDQETRIINQLNRARLVVFDDMGVERGSDYVLEKVYSIIDSRYRRQLPMIVTTNLTMDEMKNETDIRYARIYDRLFETCYPMQFTGVSWRRVTAAKRFQEMGALFDED